MKTTQYLDAVKKRLNITSDYGLQKPLGVTKSGVSWLANGGTMSNTTAARVAEILDLPLARVIADMEIERGTNDELWKRIAKKVAFVGGAAAGVALLYKLHSAGADFDQLHQAILIAALPLDRLCIMLSIDSQPNPQRQPV